MTLHGRVIQMKSGKDFKDGQARAVIQVTESGAAFHDKFEIPAPQLVLDNEVELELTVLLQSRGAVA